MLLHLAALKWLAVLLVLLQVGTPSIIGTILSAGLAIVIPSVATWGAMQVTKLFTWGNNLPDWEKRVLVVVYGVVCTGLAHALGMKLPDAWGALGATDVQAVLNTGAAFLIHRLFNPKAPTP